MLDFRSKVKPRNYLSSRQQWRPLSVILGLGLLVILGEWILNPERRQQLMNMAGGAASRGSKTTPKGGIDNLLAADPNRRAAEDTPVVLPAVDPDEAQEDETGRYFPGIKPDLLRTIEDDKAYRAEEDAAWFNLFAVLQKSKQSDLDAASPSKVSYAQLFRQSAEYRGALVTVTGTVGRAMPHRAAANGLGIESYYECWIAPVDNPTSPLVACCLELPDGFPCKDGMAEGVEVTGFFFKRWAYRDKEGAIRTAPMLVAKTLKWKHRPDFTREAEPPNAAVLLAIGGAALLTSIALAVLLYRQMRPRRARRDGRRAVASAMFEPPQSPESRDEGSSS